MSETPSKKIPRFLSCLVKGPLGCLAFALGALLVFVLLLPPALGRLVDRNLEQDFAERHAGRLQLGDAWLGSVYNEQRIDVILRDPNGDEVLRASLRGPALREVWGSGPKRYGPVVARVELLRLVEDADGSNNLEHALAALPDAPPYEELDPDSRSGFSTDTPFEIELELTVERLRYSSASGKESVLSDLVFRGKLEWGPEATHLVLEGGSAPTEAEPMRLRLELERPEFGPRRAWTSALALEGAPTALARVLCSALRPLAPFAGARLDRLEWSRQGSEVVLRCSDEGAHFELLGLDEDGLVRAVPGSVLAARLPCASPQARSLLAALLPMVASCECAGAEGVHELSLGEFGWPLDGDWSRLSGVLEIGLAPLRCTPAPELELLLGEPLTLESLALTPRPRLGAREGLLEYSDFRLPTDKGWLTLDGAMELATGQGDFQLQGEHDGLPLGPLRFARPLGSVPPVLEMPVPEMPVPEMGAHGLPDPWPGMPEEDVREAEER